MEYTLEIYKVDGRTIAGEKLVKSVDYTNVNEQWIREEVRDLTTRLYPKPKYRIVMQETFVTRKCVMTGLDYLERYDTPYFCSRSSETYWSM
jgi:hypothetical protein